MSDIGGNHIAADELRLLIERYERLDETKAEISTDQKDVMNEAKARGYDTKIMRKIMRLRKLDPHQREADDAMMATYRAALGV